MMIAPLLLVAIFSSAFYFEAEAHSTHKCNNQMIGMIYAYWVRLGGVPRRMTEHNVRCHPREVAVMATQEFFPEDVTCAVIYHYATSHSIFYMNGKDLAEVHDAFTFEVPGEIAEPLSRDLRMEIAEADGARLLYKCSRHKHSKVGPDQFVIKGVEGEVTEKGVKAMQELLVKEFNVTATLRKLSATCRLPHEKGQAHSFCGHSSSTHEH